MKDENHDCCWLQEVHKLKERNYGLWFCSNLQWIARASRMAVMFSTRFSTCMVHSLWVNCLCADREGTDKGTIAVVVTETKLP